MGFVSQGMDYWSGDMNFKPRLVSGELQLLDKSAYEIKCL